MLRVRVKHCCYGLGLILNLFATRGICNCRLFFWCGSTRKARRLPLSSTDWCHKGRITTVKKNEGWRFESISERIRGVVGCCSHSSEFFYWVSIVYSVSTGFFYYRQENTGTAQRKTEELICTLSDSFRLRRKLAIVAIHSYHEALLTILGNFENNARSLKLR